MRKCKASDVTDPDLDGLRASKVMLAVVDGLDSGTLFEVGYAVAMGIKVVAYVQNESREALQKMGMEHHVIQIDCSGLGSGSETDGISGGWNNG